VAWREKVATEKRRSYADETYWGQPVPYSGDANPDLLIVGLAPAAHGANRTGRLFTGDRSGDWLYRALHKVGIANQPTSMRQDDGLALTATLIAAVCHCAPPDNKPTNSEINNCSEYLRNVILAKQWRGILCLGGIAWLQTLRHLELKPPKFAHGAEVQFGETTVIASYHPSQQNTFTGRLTEPMFDSVIERWAGYSFNSSLRSSS
jgi:uracil-DNA glycosylase family 4